MLASIIVYDERTSLHLEVRVHLLDDTVKSSDVVAVKLSTTIEWPGILTEEIVCFVSYDVKMTSRKHHCQFCNVLGFPENLNATFPA